MTDSLAITDEFDDTQKIWDIVGNQIDTFLAAWDKCTETPPSIGAYLPSGSRVCRRLTLIELIKIDMERRWQQDIQPQSVESYAEQFADLQTGGRLPADLIYEELHIRRQAGHAVSAVEYYKRFPKQVDELRQLLEIESPDRSTAMQHARVSTKLGLDEKFDDFELLSKLGHGAFASVFLARQISMQRLVALKATIDQSAEPQTLARLDHPNIVRVYDLRSVPERGLRLLYMQYVAGGTLHEALSLRTSLLRRDQHAPWNGQTFLDTVDAKLATRGVPPPTDSTLREQLGEMTWPQVVCVIGADLAAAVDYAHRQGVLHRDIKPANILLSETGSAKLVDFNVSACSKLDGVSPESHFGGSLVYMAPEQLEAFNPQHNRTPASLDGRVDVYALGVVLFEMLAGHRPFNDQVRGSELSVTLTKMVERRQTNIEALVDAGIPKDCPTALRDVLVKCLSPDRDQRFGSGNEMETQLRLALDPEAFRLLSAPQRGWRLQMLAFPVLALVMLLILPNAVAGYFNYVYNKKSIIDRLADAQGVFWTVQLLVNGIAFPLGGVLAVWLSWPVRIAIRNASGRDVAARPANVHTRCLKLGHYLAIVGLVEWFIAGVIYPTALTVAQVPLTGSDYAHFFGSLVICGLIAAAYPFFGVTSVVIEVLYPALLRPGSVPLGDKPTLTWLNRASWWYLVIAVSVPMLSVALLVLLAGTVDLSLFESQAALDEYKEAERFRKFLLAVLSVGGTVIFLVILPLARRVHGDIATLLRLAEK